MYVYMRVCVCVCVCVRVRAFVCTSGDRYEDLLDGHGGATRVGSGYSGLLVEEELRCHLGLTQQLGLTR